jgi:V8-like Glu-specific endopeptidase
MSWLDDAVYPHHLPVARQLLLALTQLYPSGQAASFAAKKAQLNPGAVDFAQAPTYVWIDTLDEACREARLRELIEVAAEDFPRSPWRTFLDEVLTEQQTPTDPEPRSADGSAHFLVANDDVSEQEALLFNDDLTLPAGQLPGLVNALQRLLPLLPSVCRLEVQSPAGIGAGTGFRITPDLVLTNWHVLRPRETDATLVTATFGYEDGSDGHGVPGVAYPCDVASVVGNRDDDWAVIRILGLPDQVPILPLAHGAGPRLNGRAFVIQHPGGQRKRVAYTRNTITFSDDRVVQYLSDTQGGSSGSPVIDDEGRVIALHHAGGRPQEVSGQPPLKKNEGIAIGRVLAGLRQHNIAL